jgi:hypothetical protein
MVNPIVVEQDPEPDIADPAHTINSHLQSTQNQYHHHTSDTDKVYGDAYSQPIAAGLSASDTGTGTVVKGERDLPLGVAHLRSGDKGNDASASAPENRFYNHNHNDKEKERNARSGKAVLPAPALPLDSPFAPSTDSSLTEAEKDTLNHGAGTFPSSGPDAIRRADYAYPSHLATLAIAIGNTGDNGSNANTTSGHDEKAQEADGAQGSAQITPASRVSDTRGISFEQGPYGRDNHYGHHEDDGEDDHAPLPKFGFRASCIVSDHLSLQCPLTAEGARIDACLKS